MTDCRSLVTLDSLLGISSIHFTGTVSWVLVESRKKWYALNTGASNFNLPAHGIVEKGVEIGNGAFRFFKKKKKKKKREREKLDWVCMYKSHGCVHVSRNRYQRRKFRR